MPLKADERHYAIDAMPATRDTLTLRIDAAAIIDDTVYLLMMRFTLSAAIRPAP